MATEKAAKLIDNELSVSTTAALNPLVIMNVAEHYNQGRVQSKKPLGVLVGIRVQNKITILNTVELDFITSVGQANINKELFVSKIAEYTAPSSSIEVVGWYTSGEGNPDSADSYVHTQLCNIMRKSIPLFLKFTPPAGHVTMPISIYESVKNTVTATSDIHFVEVPYMID